MTIPPPPVAVSDLLLRGITIRKTVRRHPVAAYATAFRETPFRALRIIGTGHDAICLELEDGTILKITTNFIAPWVGSRPFDVPVLGRGSMPVSDSGLLINYYLQPKVVTPVTRDQMRAFITRLPSDYMMGDRNPGNLGIHEGEVLLLDPWAVTKVS